MSHTLSIHDGAIALALLYILLWSAALLVAGWRANRQGGAGFLASFYKAIATSKGPPTAAYKRMVGLLQCSIDRHENVNIIDRAGWGLFNHIVGIPALYIPFYDLVIEKLFYYAPVARLLPAIALPTDLPQDRPMEAATIAAVNRPTQLERVANGLYSFARGLKTSIRKQEEKLERRAISSEDPTIKKIVDRTGVLMIILSIIGFIAANAWPAHTCLPFCHDQKPHCSEGLARQTVQVQIARVTPKSVIHRTSEQGIFVEIFYTPPPQLFYYESKLLIKYKHSGAARSLLESPSV